jgi:integration host factor subunit alpha
MGEKTITRAVLADVIHERIGLSRNDSSEMVDLFFETICAELTAGKDVKLATFGSFQVRQKNPRIGRNPKTKEEALISARTTIMFKASPTLKSIVLEGMRAIN